MTKIRIHELARELGMDNKELLTLLAEKNIAATSHMSSLDEDVADDIRKSINNSDTSAIVKPSPEKQPEEKQPAAAPPVKGKNIVRVFRPQNVRNSARFEGGVKRRPMMKGARPMPLDRRMSPTQKLPQGAERPLPKRPVIPSAATKADEKQGKTVSEKEYTQIRKASVPPESPVRVTPPQAERPARPGTPAERPARPGTPAERPVRPGTPAERPVRIRTQVQRQGSPARVTPPQADRSAGSGTPAERPVRERPFGPQTRRTDEPSGKTGVRYQRTAPAQAKEGTQERRPFEFKRRDRGGAAELKGTRPEEQRDVRYEDRKDRDFRRGRDDKRGREVTEVSAGQMAEQQKAQRNKAKEKEKDFKDKEFKKEIEFEGRGKRRRQEKAVPQIQKPQPKSAAKKEEQIKLIILPEALTLKEFAEKMKVVPSVIIKKLFLQGKIMTVNDEISYDEAEEIALGFDVLCEKEKSVDVIEELLKEEEEDEKKMVRRPPVVCVMGHVDHGKTSLLDAIRHTNVTGREAGGITQHIGAYVADVDGESITFLDTPGHEAFTSMRMRGANSTDIAVLVVAADDGVMPQTVEAISHAKAAGTEIIVAINKIDKPGANVDRVKQELADNDLIPEDWGGHTICVPVSAFTKEGIPELLDMILLTAEMMELKANPDRSARGLVIEAKLDKGKGSVATVLVQKGTLHVGDAVAAGFSHGKVRAMMDEKGRRVKEAGPSKPVEILGLNDVPNAGDVFVGCGSEKEARIFAETFISQNKVRLLKDTKSKMSLDDLFIQIKEGDLKELNIVVKADVQGSVEALKQSLVRLSNDEVVVKVIHGGVGAINESDVILASASDAVIIGFNVRPDATAKEIAKNEGVDVRFYRVIYNAIDDVEAAMKGMLEPVFEEKVLGHAQVRRTFRASGVGTIAGAYILDGVIERSCKVRLTRGGTLMFDGPLASLKRYKDDVKEVKAGYECGFVFENYNDIQDNDLVEAYKMVEVER